MFFSLKLTALYEIMVIVVLAKLKQESCTVQVKFNVVLFWPITCGSGFLTWTLPVMKSTKLSNHLIFNFVMVLNIWESHNQQFTHVKEVCLHGHFLKWKGQKWNTIWFSSSSCYQISKQ